MLSRIRGRREAQLHDHRERVDQAWATGQVETFPQSWIDKLMGRWRKGRAADSAGANLDLLKNATSIRRAHKAGVPADADDNRLCREAALMARDMARRLDERRRAWLRELQPPCQNAPQDRERMVLLGLFLEAMHWVEKRGLELATSRVFIPGVLARLCCERWWRRKLRQLHARAVETTARVIGLVHRRAGCYVSNESLHRRRGQNARNARALESVIAVNEHGQDATLAELAAKGPANRAIRRMELMTRIAGFELIARECGHDALFVTVTCPSKMHAWRTTRAGGVEANPLHDGTTPDQAQAHLCNQWRKFSSAAARAGLELYGFRIAEPNHDATPHWHCLLFFPQMAVPRRGDSAVHGGGGSVRSAPQDEGARPTRRIRRGACRARPGRRVAVRLLRRYFLWQADPDERGARKHRVEVDGNDFSQGSAAGYVAKYVAKNIDGYKVETDLYGNPTLTSSQRVDAWASTWHIRQFQQIGGAPVGVWRELRRLHPDQAAASAGVAFALDAVNVATKADAEEDAAHDLEEGRITAAHGWQTYCELQGGHRVPRRLQRLHILKESTGEVGRYGEVMAARPVGVVTVETRLETVDAGGIVGTYQARRVVRAEVESERAMWRTEMMGVDADEAAQKARRTRVADRLRSLMAGREASRPWSPVNNCTRPAPMFGAAVERTQKKGRFHRWNRAKEPAPDGIRQPLEK